MRIRIAWFVATLAVGGCTGSPRSETWMREHFQAARTDFERLVVMSNEDFAKTRVIRVAPDFTRLADDWSWPRPEAKWGVSKERWDEYRVLFRRLELSAGLNRDGPDHGEVLLMVYGVGMAGEGRE